MDDKKKIKEYRKICKKIKDTEYTSWKETVEKEISGIDDCSLLNILKSYEIKIGRKKYLDKKDDTSSYNSNMIVIIISFLTIWATVLISEIDNLGNAIQGAMGKADEQLSLVFDYNKSVGGLYQMIIQASTFMFLLIFLCFFLVYIFKALRDIREFEKISYYQEMVMIINAEIENRKLEADVKKKEKCKKDDKLKNKKLEKKKKQ